MGFDLKHKERDENLPKYRSELLHKALFDLKNDSNVIAIYLSGSLAKGTEDHYSDIDLHIIVKPEKKLEFIEKKQIRPTKWGKVLFFEDFTLSTPYIVTHFENFIKVDSWYKVPDELTSSIWMKSIQPVYDPKQMLSQVIKDSINENSLPTIAEFEFWRGKIFAFIHETYRACMRKELTHALSQLDRIKWLIVYGWYLEMDKHFDRSYGDWSKLEGSHSVLDDQQLTMLNNWHSMKENTEILKTMIKMFPEITRLNKVLSKKVNSNEQADLFKKILNMVY